MISIGFVYRLPMIFSKDLFFLAAALAGCWQGLSSMAFASQRWRKEWPPGQLKMRHGRRTSPPNCWAHGMLKQLLPKAPCGTREKASLFDGPMCKPCHSMLIRTLTCNSSVVWSHPRWQSLRACKALLKPSDIQWQPLVRVATATGRWTSSRHFESCWHSKMCEIDAWADSSCRFSLGSIYWTAAFKNPWWSWITEIRVFVYVEVANLVATQPPATSLLEPKSANFKEPSIVRECDHVIVCTCHPGAGNTILRKSSKTWKLDSISIICVPASSQFHWSVCCCLRSQSPDSSCGVQQKKIMCWKKRWRVFQMVGHCAVLQHYIFGMKTCVSDLRDLFSERGLKVCFADWWFNDFIYNFIIFPVPLAGMIIQIDYTCFFAVETTNQFLLMILFSAPISTFFSPTSWSRTWWKTPTPRNLLQVLENGWKWPIYIWFYLRKVLNDSSRLF